MYKSYTSLKVSFYSASSKWMLGSNGFQCCGTYRLFFLVGWGGGVNTAALLDLNFFSTFYEPIYFTDILHRFLKLLKNKSEQNLYLKTRKEMYIKCNI
jgi:hypothetical protein